MRKELSAWGAVGWGALGGLAVGFVIAFCVFVLGA